MSRPWNRPRPLPDHLREKLSERPPTTSSAPEPSLEVSAKIPDVPEVKKTKEELPKVKGLPLRPTIIPRRPWHMGVKLNKPSEPINSEEDDEKKAAIDEKNRKLFEKYEKLAKKKREIKKKRMMIKKEEKAQKSEEEQEDDNDDSDKKTIVVKSKTKTRKLKKAKKLTKKQKLKKLFTYETRLMRYAAMEKEEKKRKKEKDERTARMRKQVDRSWVQQPTKMMTTEPLTRPLIQSLCVDDPKEHGSASEFMDAMFGYGTQSFDAHYPWRIADPLAFLKFIESGHRLRQQKFEALLQNPPSEDVAFRAKQKKTLESLQEIIWLMHFRRHDDCIQKAVTTMTMRSMFHFDANGEVAFVKEDGLSMIKSDYYDEKKSDILEQRRPGDMLRPVVIDGISILTKFIPNFSINHPKIFIEILINFIMQFLLDGHQVAIFLPDFCKNSENVDDKIAFDFLITHQLIRFISSPGPKAFQKAVLGEAEKTRGILVTDSEDVKIQKAVICRAVINRFPDKIGDFLIMTGFEKEFEDSEEPEDVEDSEDDDEDKLDSNQLIDKKCRMYSKQDIEELGSDKDYQLRMENQVFLISSLCHLTNFHSKPFRLIKSFLVLINRFAPELIPNFMQKEIAFDITDALENIREAKNPEIWPIGAKY